METTSLVEVLVRLAASLSRTEMSSLLLKLVCLTKGGLPCTVSTSRTQLEDIWH